MSQILGVFAKQPIPGQVKTRLAAATSPAWAALFAESMLQVTLDTFADVADRRCVVFTPNDAATYFNRIAADRYGLVPQGDGDLGQRMARFFAEMLVGATVRVVLIGADSPTLPPEFVSRAFDLLKVHDLVLGPATDGGYYLIGCTGAVPQIFEGRVSWGEANVLRDTILSLPATSRLALLPPWYDVDTLDDWRMLRGHLLAQQRAGMELGAAQKLLSVQAPSSGLG